MQLSCAQWHRSFKSVDVSPPRAVCGSLSLGFTAPTAPSNVLLSLSVYLGSRRREHKVARNAGSDERNQGKNKETVTKILLDLPEEFGSVAFQRSLARLCNSSDAAEVAVSALQRFRSALLNPSEQDLLDEIPWPPEPLGTKLRTAIKDLDLSTIIQKRPELIDIVLLNMLDLAERAQEAAEYGIGRPKVDDNNKNDLGLQMPFGLGSWSAQSASDPSAESASTSELFGLESSDALDLQNLQKLSKKNETSEVEASKNSPSDEAISSFFQEMQSQESQEALEAQLLTEEFMEKWQKTARENSLTSWDSWKEAAVESSSGDFAEVSSQKSWDYYTLYRELLGRLPELQKLVRKMGRKAGLNSPLRFDLAQKEKATAGEGVVRSPQMPSETSGITRSDGNSHVLLPGELSLIAYANADPHMKRPNSVGAKALHRLRRAESSLLSYERSAWMEENAQTLWWREFRPSLEKGPLICCVDTSRSMAGKEEAIAKAAVLEILRLAEDERRRCHLIFFSGSNELEELEVPPAPIPETAWQGVLDRGQMGQMPLGQKDNPFKDHRFCSTVYFSFYHLFCVFVFNPCPQHFGTIHYVIPIYHNLILVVHKAHQESNLLEHLLLQVSQLRRLKGPRDPK